jgi:hypothetical protein
MTGVMMGDENAVLVVQVTHKNFLEIEGVLNLDDEMTPDKPFPTADIIGDVLIDDLAIVAQVPLDVFRSRRVTIGAGLDGQMMHMASMAGPNPWTRPLMEKARALISGEGGCKGLLAC